MVRGLFTFIGAQDLNQSSTTSAHLYMDPTGETAPVQAEPAQHLVVPVLT